MCCVNFTRPHMICYGVWCLYFYMCVMCILFAGIFILMHFHHCALHQLCKLLLSSAGPATKRVIISVMPLPNYTRVTYKKIKIISVSMYLFHPKWPKKSSKSLSFNPKCLSVHTSPPSPTQCSYGECFGSKLNSLSF